LNLILVQRIDLSRGSFGLSGGLRAKNTWQIGGTTHILPRLTPTALLPLPPNRVINTSKRKAPSKRTHTKLGFLCVGGGLRGEGKTPIKGLMGRGCLGGWAPTPHHGEKNTDKGGRCPPARLPRQPEPRKRATCPAKKEGGPGTRKTVFDWRKHPPTARAAPIQHGHNQEGTKNVGTGGKDAKKKIRDRVEEKKEKRGRLLKTSPPGKNPVFLTQKTVAEKKKNENVGGGGGENLGFNQGFCLWGGGVNS